MTPDAILHTPFASLAAWRQEEEEAAAAAAGGAAGQAPDQQQEQLGGEAMEVEAPAPAAGSRDAGDAEPAGGDHSTHSAGAAASPAQAAVQQQVLSAVMEECLLNTRPEVRHICLLCDHVCCASGLGVGVENDCSTSQPAGCLLDAFELVA